MIHHLQHCCNFGIHHILDIYLYILFHLGISNHPRSVLKRNCRKTPGCTSTGFHLLLFCNWPYHYKLPTDRGTWIHLGTSTGQNDGRLVRYMLLWTHHFHLCTLLFFHYRRRVDLSSGAHWDISNDQADSNKIRSCTSRHFHRHLYMYITIKLFQK